MLWSAGFYNATTNPLPSPSPEEEPPLPPPASPEEEPPAASPANANNGDPTKCPEGTKLCNGICTLVSSDEFNCEQCGD